MRTATILRHRCTRLTLTGWAAASLLVSVASPSPLAPPAQGRSLGDYLLLSARQGFGSLGMDQSVLSKPLRVGGKSFAHGLGTHAPSQMTVFLGGGCSRFEAWVGVDDEIQYTGKSTVEFKVLGDGRELFKSGVMRSGDPAKHVGIDVSGVRELTLVSTDAGDGMDSDHADWLEPTLFPSTPRQPRQAGTGFEVRTKGLAVHLSDSGNIDGLRMGNEAQMRPVDGQTLLLGGIPDGPASVRKLANGGVEVVRSISGGSAHRCQVVDRLTPTANSVRWQVEIRSPGAAWSAPISTAVHWIDSGRAKIWMPWQDPVDPHSGLGMAESSTPWHDPLVPQPFTTRIWSYGQAPSGSWWQGDTTTLPLVSIFDPVADLGVSLIQSPEDETLDAETTTSDGGWIAFTRSNRRLGEGKTVRYSMDLVAHRADPRGGLAWMANRYARFFDPPNPAVDKIDGCAAYSGDERVLDAEAVDRLKKMAFGVMWKLSDDYAYMGMYLPPVKGADERWNRIDDAGSPPNYKPLWTSFRRLNDYGRMLESHGFHLLSYFNTTEYGHDMQDVPMPSNPNAADLWKDPSGYLKAHMPNAPFRMADGKTIQAWQGGWVVDPGDPDYTRYLLEQAKRHIDNVPSSIGICIDRADYLRIHNDHADDGISFYDGKKSRSFMVSWRTLLGKLGPLMHRNGKVVFSNLMHPRLDLARHLDGIYNEFGNQPTVMNGCAFLCLRKPLLAWTRNEDELNDAFFQRHLYMGAFPTAPYPTNNHCIQPSPERDRWYLDYGPLFDAMRGGRKWVLAEHVIEAGAGAKANVFEVPGGYVVPVTFAGEAKTVRVTLHGLRGVTRSSLAEVWLPGNPIATPVPVHRQGRDLVLEVPVARGAGMVVLKK